MQGDTRAQRYLSKGKSPWSDSHAYAGGQLPPSVKRPVFENRNCPTGCVSTGTSELC